MTDKAWKEEERRVAALFGQVRRPGSGAYASDGSQDGNLGRSDTKNKDGTEADIFIEVKNKKAIFSADMRSTIKKTTARADELKKPWVVSVHYPGDTGKHRRFAIVDLDYFAKLWWCWQLNDHEKNDPPEGKEFRQMLRTALDQLPKPISPEAAKKAIAETADAFKARQSQVYKPLYTVEDIIKFCEKLRDGYLIRGMSEKDLQFRMAEDVFKTLDDPTTNHMLMYVNEVGKPLEAHIHTLLGIEVYTERSFPPGLVTIELKGTTGRLP